MPRSIILFDLDGTLTDSKDGIVNCVRYALEKMGAPIPSDDVLQSFVGPPLVDSFKVCCGFSDERAWEAVRAYRERFSTVGLLENALYDGVPQMLESLRAEGLRLSIATSKPTVYAKRIVRNFGIDGMFDHVVGSNIDGSRVDKTEVVRFAMEQYADAVPDDFIMVGDRKHDMVGAANCGALAVGVLYGYGSREELEAFRPAALANSVADLRDTLRELTRSIGSAR